INTLHGFYFHDNMNPRARSFYIATEKIAARCSDVILSQNSEDIQTAIREGICRADQIKSLGNGIDVQRFDRSRLSSEVLEEKRRELGLPAGAPVVGFVGRLVAEKGILELLRAAQTVLKQVPEARFLFIGPEDKEKGDALTQDIAQEYGIAHACVFPGMRQDMPELYALMDVFVLPSHREGFPRSPMEASAMETPCIATDIRGCREAVLPDRNGVLVPLRDADALADAIVDLLKNPGKARRMGQAGRQVALERFDERLVFDKVIDEYARLLRARGLPVPDPVSKPSQSQETSP
ncbi:MAG TPA: glycosyltransferase family 4 protein, partial [Pyrinomonadaceae bacterium]|nr:glycosyltransferase family 4 protein [Pyrinomonadaceae bacterium]